MKKLSKTELYIMQCLWASENGLTTKQITKQINETRDIQIDQRTVATLVYRLMSNDMLKPVDTIGQFCIYVPLVTKKEVTKRFLRETLSDWFNGSIPDMKSAIYDVEKECGKEQKKE